MNFDSCVRTPSYMADVSYNDVLFEISHPGGVQVCGPMGSPSQSHFAGSFGSQVMVGGGADRAAMAPVAMTHSMYYILYSRRSLRVVVACHTAAPVLGTLRDTWQPIALV